MYLGILMILLMNLTNHRVILPRPPNIFEPKKCPTFSRSSGISQNETTFSKVGYFLGQSVLTKGEQPPSPNQRSNEIFILVTMTYDIYF